MNDLRVPKLRASGTRQFVGFDRTQIETLLLTIARRVLERQPDVRCLSQVDLYPLKRFALGQFYGGVFQQNTFLGELGLYRGWAANKKNHVQAGAIEKDFRSYDAVHLKSAWFGGYLFDHYGHFLTEGLSRLSAIGNSTDPIIFFNPMRVKKLRPYMTDVFRHIGIDPDRIELCNALTKIDSLAAQEPTFQIRGFVNTIMRRLLKRPSNSATSPRKLFLSRAKLGRKRKILGEAALERRLVDDLGFDVVYPEKLPLPEQITLLDEAETIVACEGSALHTLMFCNSFKKVITLCGGVPNVNFLLVDELFDADVVYVGSAHAEFSDPAYVWAVDVNKAVGILKELT